MVGKLALRTLSWGDVLVGVYVVAAVVMLALGRAGVHSESNTWWALLSGILVASALILFYLAIESGEASKVVPISAAYQAVTLVVSAIFLSEDISLLRVAGLVLVIGGVVMLSVAD